MDKMGREFIEKTKYKNMGLTAQNQGKPFPPMELDYDASSNIIDLPVPQHLRVEGIELRKAIEFRRSRRKYTGESITPQELSYLLWCTQGVKEVIAGRITLRTVPSAGSRHAFETFLLVNNVVGIKPGLYRYLAVAHMLLEINTEAGLADGVVKAGLDQEFMKTSAVTFIWVADTYRMTWRYGERGYRYLFLDAGHVCQNLYLAGENLNLGVCGIGAYNDDAMNEILGIDGKELWTIYIGTVGQKPKSPDTKIAALIKEIDK
jgi:SagB-type dehydrogenase family enzyme